MRNFLGAFPEKGLAGQMIELRQHLQHHAIAGGEGRVLGDFRARDQCFGVVGGKKIAAVSIDPAHPCDHKSDIQCVTFLCPGRIHLPSLSVVNSPVLSLRLMR